MAKQNSKASRYEPRPYSGPDKIEATFQRSETKLILVDMLRHLHAPMSAGNSGTVGEQTVILLST